MKTQLLEDIGQSATLTLVPSAKVANPLAEPKRPTTPHATSLQSKPRSAFGVWRQKPAADVVVPAPAQEDPQPTSTELDSVFEEIAALEAQYAALDVTPVTLSLPPETTHQIAPVSAEPFSAQAAPPVEPDFVLLPPSAYGLT